MTIGNTKLFSKIKVGGNMKTVIISLISIGIIIFAFVLAAVITNCNNYKFYKRVYRTLSSRTFYLNISQVYSCRWDEKQDNFVWFVYSNEFQLNRNCYLHNAMYTKFDPYSYYWLKKYQRWFKKNVNINNLENY
jgi:hypothetical protein